MSKELMIERIEKAQKEIEAKREKIKESITFSINIIHIPDFGTVCTGDMLSVKI